MKTNEALLQNFLDTLQRDVDAAMRLLADDVVWVCRGLPNDREAKGRREVRELFAQNTAEWRDFHAQTQRMSSPEENHVVSVGRYAGAHRELRNALDAPFTHRWWIEDGQIVRFEQTVDRSAVARARAQRYESGAGFLRWELGAYGLQALQLRTHESSDILEQAHVEVSAIGLNFADVMQAEGRYAGGPSTPYTPAFELAGHFRRGRQGSGEVEDGALVMGLMPGALTTRLMVPEERLRAAPKDFGAVDAAAAFVRQATAFGCLHALGAVAQGQHVLITAAASSVGREAITRAKMAGAKVFGTASTPEKLESVRALGLDGGALSADEDWAQQLRVQSPGGFDLVLESVGGSVYEQCLTLVKPFGRLVIYGNASGQDGKSPHASELLFNPRSIMSFELGTLFSLPDPSPYLPKAFTRADDLPTLWPFAQAHQALAQMQARKSIGKQVVVI